MKTIFAAAIATVALVAPASAKDWWTTTGRIGEPVSACDHITRDEGIDPAEQMARGGSIIMRNAIQPPILWSNHSESPLGVLSIVRFKFREGPDVIFAYAETPEACEMVRRGEIPMPER
jgi:hypothetical protein